MRSGRLTDIADVLKNLSWVQKQKALSFREKKMYERARYLIVSEIAQINGLPEGEVATEVEKALDRAMIKRRPSRPWPGIPATTDVRGNPGRVPPDPSTPGENAGSLSLHADGTRAAMGAASSV